METETQVEGTLGSPVTDQKPTVMKNQSEILPCQTITNVRVTSNYPNTGEYHNQYLFFSGICILLLLFVLKKKAR